MRTHLAFIDHVASLWKSLAFALLVALIAGNFLIYVLAQQQYAQHMKRSYKAHEQTLLNLRQRLLIHALQDEGSQAGTRFHELELYFQNVPDLFRLQLLERNFTVPTYGACIDLIYSG